MAVDPGHLTLFPSQLNPNNRGIMNPVESGAAVAGADCLYATAPAVLGYGAPISGASVETSVLPLYAATAMKAAAECSDLTYNLPPSLAVSRKRPREYSLIDPFISPPTKTNRHGDGCPTFSFLGEDVSAQILQQQVEIDHFISQHMEKVRAEVEERRKRQSRRAIAAIEAGVSKRLRAKEEEMEKIGRLNWALEERVKSLYMENQIWKDVAHANEATANSLRSNLQQALAEARQCRRAAAPVDDAESWCGSSDSGAGGFEAISSDNHGAGHLCRNDCGGHGGAGGTTRRRGLCRSCDKAEACVLLMPCRHLCLCAACGSTLHICPICHAHKDASFHVNLS